IDLSRSEIEVGLLDVIPLELCERHLIFPVRVEATRLQLAMSDPMDHVLVSEIEFKTGVRLAPMIALESSIKNAIVEARRAQKAGSRKISPSMHRAKPSDAPAPGAAVAAAAGGPGPLAGAPASTPLA